MDIEQELLMLELSIQAEEKALEDLECLRGQQSDKFIERLKCIHLEHLYFLKLKHAVYSGALEEDKKAQRKAPIVEKVLRRIGKFSAE